MPVHLKTRKVASVQRLPRRIPAFLQIVGVVLAWLNGQAMAAVVGLQGPLINIYPSAAFWPAAECNPFSNQYLVIWVNVADPNGWQLKARRVDANTGSLLGSEFYISPDPANIRAIIGAVTYNSANHEWFLAYQASVSGGPDDVFGQRIASDGNKVGSYIPLVSKAGYQNDADVSYDSVNNRYLVVWKEQVGGVNQIFSRLFDATGTGAAPALRLSEVDNRLKYTPKVAYNPVAQEFMVVWEDLRNWPGTGQDNDYADVYGQRVTPAGQKIGVNIPVYAPIGAPYAPNGQDIPGGIACDTLTGRYAVGSQKLGGGAPDYNTVGLVIDALGARVGSVFNLSRPSFGAQPTPAFNPASGTYFISYEAASGVAGKLISPGGTLLSGEETIIGTIGSIRDNVLTVRPGDGQFLQVAISDGGAIVAQRFITGQSVTQFVIGAGHGLNALSWVNPTNGDFVSTLIRFRTDAFPTGPSDGTLLIDKPNVPGSSDSLLHSNLTNGSTYYYAAFAHNSTPLYAPPAFGSGMPFLKGDFDHDNDVDQSDFARLQLCLSGVLTPPAGCDETDLDHDSSVDNDDVAEYLECVGGADLPSPC